uniref:Uncharacterized protein n=1 Tax=Eucampia antarctica TaxID=49252 RepID=A0A7S2R365_9STRA
MTSYGCIRVTKSSSSALLLLARRCQVVGGGEIAVNNNYNSGVRVWNSSVATSYSSSLAGFSTSTSDNVVVKKERPPSVLTSLEDGFKAREAWSAITKKYAGGFPVRHSDFQQICSQTEVGDSKLILHMLSHLKRCNRFIIQPAEADQVMSAMSQNYRNDDDNDDSSSSVVDAALFVGRAFVDKDTGLYFAASVDTVEDIILKPLLSGEEAPHSEEAAGLAVDIIYSLLYRGSRPYQYLKKRAARKYLKQLECPVGPYPSTFHLAIQILLHDNPSNITAAQKLAKRYVATNRTVLEQTTQLMVTAQEEVDNAAAAAAKEIEDSAETTEDEAASEETEEKS